MFCPNCGKQLEDTVKFCDGCGSRVAEEAATTQTVNATGSKPLLAFKVAGIDFSISLAKIDLIGLIAAIVAIIALYLPYVTISAFGMSESTSFSSGEDYGIILTLLIVFIVFNVFGFSKIKNVVGYAYFIIMIIEAISFSSEIKQYYVDYLKYYGDYFKDVISYGIGFWLLLISGLVMVAVPLVKKFVLKK